MRAHERRDRKKRASQMVLSAQDLRNEWPNFHERSPSWPKEESELAAASPMRSRC